MSENTDSDNSLATDGGQHELPDRSTAGALTEWHDLSAFQRDLLTAIQHAHATDDVAEVCGLDVKRRVEGFYNEQVNHGRLYPNLDELVERGLVHKGVIDRRTNSYELTAFGREVLVSGSHRHMAVADTIPEPPETARADGGEGGD